MTRNILRAAITSSAAIVAVAAAPSVSAAAAVKFDIPAQSMQAALAQFSRQSGIQILFSYDQVEGLRAPSVNGRMAPNVALSRLIAGSGLKVSLANSNVIALSLIGGAKPARRMEVASLSVTSLPMSMQSAMMVQGSAASIAPQAALDEPGPDIVVTGSRGLARTITDSPTPIDVISAKELEATGKPGVLAALNTLVPSFNVPTRAGGGISTVISTGGLRGLNPDQTLILVNGKRRHKTSLINSVSSFYNGSVPADLDLIPTSAIDHIEVLRDGAAAQYGSDAIAGVINLILKSGTNGGSASFTAGQNYDRSDGENYLVQGNWGTKLGESGFLDIFANGKIQQVSNRAVPIADNINLYPLVNGQRDPREATIDRLVTKNYGAFPAKGFNVGYNVGYDAGGIHLYSFGTYSQRNSELNFTFRAPNNTATLPEVYPNGFRPRLDVVEDDFEFALGLKGQVAGWDWDLSTTYGKNYAYRQGYETYNPTLGPTSPTELYVGALKSTEWVNSLDLTKGFDVAGHLQVSAGLQHRHETYEIMPGEPDSYAAGGYTYVRNGVTIRPAPGGQAANGITPEDAGSISRDNLAAYADVAWDPSPSTTIGAAARFEHYDDASGDTLIGKVNFRQAVTPWFSFRGAAGTGFRAPALAQQIYASTSGQFRMIAGVLNLLQIKTLPVGSAAAIALGSEPLTPEKSTNFSGGFVLTPLQNLSVTVDAYQVKVKDRIAVTSTLTGSAVSAILIANGLSSDISAQYYTNAIDTRTRGIDIVASYRHALGGLKLSWNLGYNYNKTRITNIKANPPELASLGAGFVLFDRLSQMNITENLPKTKLFIGNVATLGDFSLSSRVTRFGSFNSFGNATATVGGVPVYGSDRHFGAKFITDTEFTWQATPVLAVSVGANNLFNVYPDYDSASANASLGSGFYATSGAYGFTGGYYYGKVAVKF
ncbi:TonB-dependent receptor [Sphingobium aromaticiconvertens]|uniref:TonB-dependent receptor n=1 Tax=Sphingobium aromaticiconvertens TaxID=365341 RepID=UPI00301663C8